MKTYLDKLMENEIFKEKFEEEYERLQRNELRFTKLFNCADSGRRIH